MDMSDDQILGCHRKIANALVMKLNAQKGAARVAVAMEMIAGRIVDSGNSLAVLRNNALHDYRFDAASILRNIYDVMLQGLYIMADPAERRERAELYLDFMDVERKRRIELMDSSSTDLAKRISDSPKRPSSEPRIETRFNEVKGKYETKKGKMRRDWYPGTLRDLAKAADLEPEYELMQRFLSGVVHSSPLTLKEGPLVRGFLLMDWHWRFAFRILGAYADHKGIALDETEQGLVDAARQNVFDLP